MSEIGLLLITRAQISRSILLLVCRPFSSFSVTVAALLSQLAAVFVSRTTLFRLFFRRFVENKGKYGEDGGSLLYRLIVYPLTAGCFRFSLT